MKCQFCGIKRTKVIESWYDKTCPDCRNFNIEYKKNNYKKLVKLMQDDLSM